MVEHPPVCRIACRAKGFIRCATFGRGDLRGIPACACSAVVHVLCLRCCCACCFDKNIYCMLWRQAALQLCRLVRCKHLTGAKSRSAQQLGTPAPAARAASCCRPPPSSPAAAPPESQSKHLCQGWQMIGKWTQRKGLCARSIGVCIIGATCSGQAWQVKGEPQSVQYGVSALVPRLANSSFQDCKASHTFDSNSSARCRHSIRAKASAD